MRRMLPSSANRQGIDSTRSDSHNNREPERAESLTARSCGCFHLSVAKHHHTIPIFALGRIGDAPEVGNIAEDLLINRYRLQICLRSDIDDLFLETNLAATHLAYLKRDPTTPPQHPAIFAHSAVAVVTPVPPEQSHPTFAPSLRVRS